MRKIGYNKTKETKNGVEMAFDGITISCIVKECNDKILGGRISKIAQPEQDELMLTIKNGKESFRILISADPSLPLFYFTSQNKLSPMTAPNFCMLLRKHLQNSRILSVSQPKFERIIRMELEHLDEMGDLCRKFLVVELMGKHSNIIFCDDQNQIIDSIKRISTMVSSVREVLPGRTYFIPDTQEKKNPLLITQDEFILEIQKKSISLYKAIYSVLTGVSPLIAQEICFQAGIDADLPTNSLDESQILRVFHILETLRNQIINGQYKPNIQYENGIPKEYAAILLTSYSQSEQVGFESISELLENFYAQKNTIVRIRQRSVDLRKIVQTALERNVRKYDIQLKQLEDTQKKEAFKLFGELLNTYGYEVPTGSKSCEVLNYYTNEMITIPLNPEKSPIENAKNYFEKYNKLKRTYEALIQLTKETHDEIEHLDSILNALDIASHESDLVQIKEELIQSGYMKRKGKSPKDRSQKERVISKPFHYVSRDGFHIYVGKNNIQNDEITFKLAIGNDMWFHAKGIPGSHVLVKTNGEKLPDTTYEDAARLAAYYSKAKENDKVEIDYTEKKNVKKPSGGKPGFVVYYTNYSMMIEPKIDGITVL